MGLGLGLGLGLSESDRALDVHEWHEAVVDAAVRLVRVRARVRVRGRVRGRVRARVRVRVVDAAVRVGSGPLQVLFVTVHVPSLRCGARPVRVRLRLRLRLWRPACATQVGPRV